MASRNPQRAPTVSSDGRVSAAGALESRLAATQAARHAYAHRICPGCSAELVDRGCKMRCLRCGFFLDCSDG